MPASPPPIATSQRQYILSHMLRMLEQTPAISQPFPHFTVEGFFPNDTYAELLDLLPNPKEYVWGAYDGTGNGDDSQLTRRKFGLVNSAISKLSSKQQAFWYSVRSALGSTELKRAAFAKLSDGLAYRYGCRPNEVADLPGFALPELFHETQGYSIAPHPDTRRKVVTMQVALPRDASQKHLGTEFYKRSLNPAAYLREPRGFDTVKVCPFLPNTATAFSVLNTVMLKSWHGRTKFEGTSGVRNSILNIWYSKAEEGNAEVTAENARLDITPMAA